MKADFETLGAIIGIVLNGVEIAALAALLENESLKELRKYLSGLNQFSDYTFTKRRWKKLGWYLVALIPLNLINLALYAALIAILRFGPDKVFAFAGLDTASEALTPGEKVIYWTWLVLAGLAYIIKCLAPSGGLVVLFLKVAKWLWNHRKF